MQPSLKSRFARRAAMVAAALAMILPASATAAQHQNANVYQHWRLPSTAWNIDQHMYVGTDNRAMYYAMTFGLQNVNGGGYMGLQTDGNGRRFVRFSIWNSTAASPGRGASCRSFDGEGVGRTCELNLGWATHRTYTYRLWLLGTSGGYATWGAWIIDRATGREYHIGNIRAPRGAGQVHSVSNFNEYYGNAFPCHRVPSSSVFFLTPRVNQGGYSAYNGDTVANCSGGRVTRGYGGAALSLGVR